MGGTLTVVPDGFISSLTRGWAVVGGGTLNSAVADANDGTYITDTTPGVGSTRITWTMATSALPAGAAVKYIYPVVRNSQPTGNRQLLVSIGTYNPPDNISYQSPSKVWTPVAGIADTAGTAAGTVPQARSQGVVDLLIISVHQYPSSAFAEDHRIYRVEGKIVYVDSPTASGAALYPPSANTLTTRPGVQWSFNSTDGFTQYEYRVALWKQADVALYPGGRAAFEASADRPWNGSFTGTDAATKNPVWVSKSGNGWVVSPDNNTTPTVDLVNSTAYTYYVQVSALHSGARLSHPTSMSILDFTQSLTTPALPTSITPTWIGSGTWYGSIAVVYPTQTLGAWTGRKLIVQTKDTGTPDVDSSWRDLPEGTIEVGSGSGTTFFVDQLIYKSQSKMYRVKSLLYSTSTGYTSGSAWVNSSSIVADYDRFVIRDPYNSDSAIEFRILGDFESSHDEIQGVFQPLGSTHPVVVSDVITGRRWNIELLVRSKLYASYLDGLREAQSPLVLHTDMPFLWWWVRIGPQVRKRMIRQPGRVDPNTRSEIWQMELIEVAAPVGQPASES